MSTKNRPLTLLRSRIALRLWGAMMVLAAIGVVFLWVVQIALFEPNYIDASMATLVSNSIPLAEEFSALPTEDTSGGANLLRGFSKSINARVYLVAADGQTLFACISGKIGTSSEAGETQKEMQYIIKDLPKVLAGETSQRANRSAEFSMSLIVGVPATYQGTRAAVFVYQPLAAMQTMQALNRNQLVMLSVIMTLMASLIAVLLTRNFTRPIHSIESAVRRLADGDLSAVPDVRRDDELGRLSRSVEELGVALQRVDVLRKEVIANVSHELSAPLALIQGYSEMIRDIHGDDPARRNQDIELVLREASRLRQMVDDIMDYSKFQSGYGKLNLSVANLYGLVSDEVKAARQAAAEYQISVELASASQQIPAGIDPLKMSQVIRNLLNNAVNYTANGQTIAVSISQDANSIRVSVRNPGRPIPEKERAVIWERYQRIQHQGGRREGTGIGLSIVSTILEAHGMRYGVESGADDNTFWFEMSREL